MLHIKGSVFEESIYTYTFTCYFQSGYLHYTWNIEQRTSVYEDPFCLTSEEVFYTQTATVLLVEGWHTFLPSSSQYNFFSSLYRQDFVDAYVDYIFNKSVASLFSAFHAGFHKVCGGKVLQLFQPSELQAMVIGNTNYDWKELEKVKTIAICFIYVFNFKMQNQNL